MTLVIKHNNIIYIVKQSCIHEKNLLLFLEASFTVTNLDDVSYDRLIWKRCGVAPESTKPEDKLLNVIVYFMTL